MGSKYVEGRSIEFSKVYKESSPSTPLFFILSPGVDPLKDVEVLGEPLPPPRPTPDHEGCEALLVGSADGRCCTPHLPISTNEKGPSRRGGFLPSPGRKLNFTIDNGRIHNVSLGQGQEAVAERALEVAATQGHWVILQVGGGHQGAPRGTQPCRQPGTPGHTGKQRGATDQETTNREGGPKAWEAVQRGWQPCNGARCFSWRTPHQGSDTARVSRVSPARAVPCCAAPALCRATVGIGEE